MLRDRSYAARPNRDAQVAVRIDTHHIARQQEGGRCPFFDDCRALQPGVRAERGPCMHGRVHETAYLGEIDPPLLDGCVHRRRAGEEASREATAQRGSRSARAYVQAHPPADGEYEASEEITLKKGDLLALMSDGVEESISAQGELFGKKRIMEMLVDKQSARASKIVAHLHQAGRAHEAADQQPDDFTTIVLKVK